MKYIFIGDIHGKVNAVEKALSLNGKKIFVGDFMDSYNRSPEDHKKCLELVMEAMRAGQPVQCIYGNHELSYIYPNQHRCSGFKYEHQQIMWQMDKEIERNFVPYIIINKFILVSHAGLTKQIWDEEGLTFENLLAKLKEWWPDLCSPMHYIGRYRGGNSKVGGMFWCDFEQEFEPVPGLNQIFGHTRGQGIRQKGLSFCIDGLDKNLEFLELEIEE